MLLRIKSFSPLTDAPYVIRHRILGGRWWVQSELFSGLWLFLWMVTSGSSTLPSFDWASKKASHPSQLTREDRSRYSSESTPKTAGHTSLPHIGFLSAKSERSQLFCLSRRYYLTRVAFWARWMGFTDLISSNWTAPSHVGGKGGVFRLDSLH